MELVEEIRNLFADSNIQAAYVISSITPDYRAWVIRFWDSFGVAVPYQGREVNEEFANASLYSAIYNIGNEDISCLFLMSTVEFSRNEFAAFCRDFVYPGIHGELRERLINDPVEWWRHWKTLIGNSIMEKKPYAVLGELIMYDYLLRIGREVEWEGPKAASHDLICKNEEYEVKSTLSRYDKIIHVTGQFQLVNGSRDLFLFFCRFERDINGTSINDMVEKLIIDHGISRDEINNKLCLLGYSNGNSARQEAYKILEAEEYAVNDSFPRIMLDLFKTGSLPNGIKQLEYDVDLSVVEGNTVPINMLGNAL